MKLICPVSVLSKTMPLAKYQMQQQRIMTRKITSCTLVKKDMDWSYVPGLPLSYVANELSKTVLSCPMPQFLTTIMAAATAVFQQH